MYLAGANITGPATLAIIFCALVAAGANTSALAAYFAAALLIVLGLKALSMPARELARTLGEHWLSLLAALGFIALAGLSAAPSFAPALAPFIDAAEMRSLSPYRTIEGVAAFGAPVAAFGLGVFSSSDRERRSWNARALLLFAIAFSAWGLITYNPAEALRLSAHLGSANTAACIYGMLAVFSAACLARAALQKGWQDAHSMSEHLSVLARASPLAVAALVMSLACVALTLSRGGIAAAAAGFAVLMTCLIVREGRTPGRRAAFYLTAFGALLAIAGYVMFKRNALSAAALNGRGDAVSFEDRQILIDIYWRAFLDRPAFGHGVNTYHEISTLAADPQTWEALRSSGSVHNIYVQALAESGAIGAALLGLAFLVPLWRGFRRAFSGDEWAAGAVAMSVLCLAQGLVDFGLQTPAIAALLAFCLGAFALKRSRRAD